MNIIFFGNGHFSQKSLESLYLSNKHNLLLVITNDIKKQGRGLKEKNTTIANYAIENNIELLKTNNIKDPTLINSLLRYKADIFVVIEYKILPKEIFTMPKYGSINIHASILPNYRGAAPIQRAIMNGDTTLGVTSFKIQSQIDAGNIICKKSEYYGDSLPYGDIYRKLSILGASLLLETLDKINTNVNTSIQNSSLSTTAPKIKKNEFKISFDDSSININNKVRALTPPSPYSVINNKKVKLINTYYSNNSYNLKMGEHIFLNDCIYIGCKTGSLKVSNFQFESKKIITSKDFANIQHLKDIKFE